MPSTLPIAAAVIALTLAAPGVPDTEMDSFVADDSAQDDLFGASIAIDAGGAYLVVGAPGVDSSAGAAYVFKRQRDGTYLQIDQLIADETEADDLFGSSVAIQKDIVMVGAPGDDADEGAAYVFKRQRDGSYLQIDKLTAEDNAAGDLFGASIAFDKDTAVVGAPGNELNAGSAYIFRQLRTGAWDQLTQIVASDTAADALFGTSVSIYKDTILLGAPGAGGTGAAYVFSPNDDDIWTETDTFTSEDADDDDLFGQSVSLDNATALIGAPGDDSAAGDAYIFTLNDEGTWDQADKLLAEDDAADDGVGTSVDLDKTTAVVGAPGDDAAQGAIFIFRRERDGTWPQAQKLTAGAGVDDDTFGSAVGCGKKTAVSGAPGAGNATGGAYIYR